MAASVTLTAVDAQPNECALSAPLRVTVRRRSLATARRAALARFVAPCSARRVALARPHAADAQWEFTTGAALPGAAWEVTYVVDAAEHQRELPLGRTSRTDYAAGACAAEFTCDAIDVAGVPQGCVRHTKAQHRPLMQLAHAAGSTTSAC